MAAVESLYSQFAFQASELAVGRGTIELRDGRVSRQAMTRWLKQLLEAVPVQIGVSQLVELRRTERMSLARCESLWLSIGVDAANAQALAHQTTVGSRSEFFDGIESSFCWVSGDFGAGKSLSAERLFQNRLSDFASGRRNQIPVFVRALEMHKPLMEIVKESAERLGKIELCGVLLIVDGLDEAGGSRARNIIAQAYEVSRGFEKTSVIVVSTPLDFQDAYKSFRLELPPLEDSEVEAIVSMFAGKKIDYWTASRALGQDVRLPLFSVLLGMRMRSESSAQVSRGALLEEVVRKALRGRARQLEIAVDRLCFLACTSTDIGGGPVSARKLGWSLIETSSLCDTRLVAESEDSFFFPVSSIRLWFAAEALQKRMVTSSEFAGNRIRTFHWRPALAMFVATQGFDAVSDLMTTLARSQPSIAANLVAAALHDDFDGTSPTTSAEFGRQVRVCLEAWFEGLAPLSRWFAMIGADGRLLPMRVFFEGKGPAWIAWTSNPKLPEVTVVEDQNTLTKAPNVVLTSMQRQVGSTWRSSMATAASQLMKAIQALKRSAESLDKELHFEALWNQIVGFIRKSGPFAVERLSWHEIESFRPLFQQLHCWEALQSFRVEGEEFIHGPHPAADLINSENTWRMDAFSAERALDRERSILSAALRVYQRIVNRFFPKFVHDLKYSCLWPARLVGTLGRTSST